MTLKFVSNNRFLEVVSADERELRQLYDITYAESYNHITKTTDSESFMHENKYIPAGFWLKIMKLSEFGYAVKILNLDEFVDTKLSKEAFDLWITTQNFNFTPYDYQAEGAFLACRFPHCKNLYDTSAGKSFIFFMISRFLLQQRLKPGLKVLIVVPRTMLVTQMPADFKEYLDDDYLICDGLMGGGWSHENSNVVVANIDSLRNKDQAYLEQFGAVLVDEGHKVKTNSMRKIMQRLFMSKNLSYINAMSGTFSDNKGDMSDLIETAMAGPTLVEYYVEDLRKYNSVVDCDIKCIRYVASGELSSSYYNDEQVKDTKTRWRFEQAYVQSVRSYRTTIIDISLQQKYNQVLLFNTKKFLYSMAAYAEELIKERDLSKTIYIISGDVGKKERDDIKHLLENTEDCIVFAMYQIMDTGISIKNLGGIHLVDSTKSFVRVRQSIGRVLRLHKNIKLAYIFDHTMYFKKDRGAAGPRSNIYVKHQKERIKIYKKREFPVQVINVPLNDKSIDYSLTPDEFVLMPIKKNKKK